MALTIIFFAILLCYCVTIIWLSNGLSRLLKQSAAGPAGIDEISLPTISVIVAARNEAHNLPRLIHCLKNQQYPDDKIEFLIVDDRSEDSSWMILSEAAESQDNFRSFRIRDLLTDYAPKKRALDYAIRAAKGEILLLTDADCAPSPKWAHGMVQNYQNNVVLVPGYSYYRYDYPAPAFIQGVLSLEYFSHAAVAAASAGLGLPLTAAGCNFSYRRKTYFEVGGFSSIQQWVSGDDDLFLHNVARHKLGEFRYALAPESFMSCAAPVSFLQFWNQRIRYASKGLHYSFSMTSSLIAVYILNLFVVLSGPLFILGFTQIATMVFFGWTIKSFVEYFFLSRAASLFHEKRLLKYFLPTAFLHPFYIFIFAFLGVFSRFKWKDAKTLKKQKTEPVPND